MPTLQTLLGTDDEQDEQIDPLAPDPVNVVTDPAHPLWLEEQLWTVGVLGKLFPIATFLVGERDSGYMDLPPQWAEEPSEDTRDWGTWAFHGLRAYGMYED